MNETAAIKPDSDHFSGSPGASYVLIEYGSYACSHCRDAHQVITRVQERIGVELVYVFRHKPLRSDPWALPSAILVELAATKGLFWDVHAALMNSQVRSQEDLLSIANQYGITEAEFETALSKEDLQERIEADEESSRLADIHTTPTFFINGRRYEGAWDEMSLIEALDAPFAHRLDRVAHDFAGWAPATGSLLALCACVALLLANSEASDWLHATLETPLGIQVGQWSYSLSLHALVNDCLMSVFFLVVGLEIKRELTIGELSNWRIASLPIAAALGGMFIPAFLYLTVTWDSELSSGWGIPMATDIAFALGLLALLGRRVPISLKVFLTALAIVDDLGAIVVIAVFYGHGFELEYALFAVLIFSTLIGFNLAGVSHTVPYAVLGILLWACVYASGLHATLAGILLAIAIPTRPPPNLRGLLAQARAIVTPQMEATGNDSNRFPERPMLRALDAVHERLESPAHRIERLLEPWSSFLILPLFALANAGVPLGGLENTGTLAIAIMLGLVLGKPLGISIACWLLVRSGMATLPGGVSWPMITGVGLLAGVGFTMSIFISNEAFANPSLVEGAKVSVLAASVLAAVIGIVILNKTLPDVEARSES